MRYQFMYTWLISMALFVTTANAVTETKPAIKVVEETASEVINRIRQDRDELNAHPEQVFELVDELIIPHFDFSSMSKWVLGKNWRRANEAQREKFTNEFRTLLVRTYARALLEYSEQEVKYLSEESSPKSNLVVVRTEITQAGSSSIPISYRMHISDGNWKVVDVSIDGVSLVSTYRGEFKSHIRKSGLDNLIAKLAERNNQSLHP